ncbi:hypothetical protein [Haloarcula laminariae]|uniref:hypothetical protein n=1 Tax=Haloarcula laminariae TaxID=2961577 RepID=UPI0021C63767|nr:MULTISPECIES: hypothetical protein [Halomicroarcula]
MAGVGQGATVEENGSESVGAVPALRINTDVFAGLSESVQRDSDDEPTIVSWLDCWRC